MNDKNSYYYILASIYENIEHYKNIIAFSDDLYKRLFYEKQFYNERMRLNYLKHCYCKYVNNRENQLKQEMQINQRNLPEERVFTALELAEYDGTSGKPAYVAVNGIVYDVSLEATWGGGTHFSLYAGKDLTNQFNGCHNGMLEVLRNLPIVGMLQE